MNIGMDTLNKLELDWLKRLHRQRHNPASWQMHDCPNAIVVVMGDSAWKFSGSISKLVIASATIIVLALTALLSLFIYMVVDFYCVACITFIVLFKMILNTLKAPPIVNASNYMPNEDFSQLEYEDTELET